MKIRFGYWKDGKPKALTMSYDDGQVHDLRLIDIFNRYGIKGTFHLNSGKIGTTEKYVTAADVAEKYAGHEVSAHTLTHPFLERVPAEEAAFEILEDRKNLEAMCGYPVRGMSYPYGTWCEALLKTLPGLGIRYSRTTRSTGKFNPPDNFLLWDPTCKHTDPALFTYLEKFQNIQYGLSLFYVWGHSYEFPRDDNWDVIERFCAEAGGSEDVWYATNIEIVDYLTALRSLQCSADRTMFYNPTATDVWVEADKTPVKIPAGQLVKL